MATISSSIKENPAIPDNRLTGRILMASLFLPYSYSSEDFSIYRNLSLSSSINGHKGSVKAAISASASLKRVLSSTSLKQTKHRLRLKAKASQKIAHEQQQQEQQQRKERLQDRLFLKHNSSSSLKSNTSNFTSTSSLQSSSAGSVFSEEIIKVPSRSHSKLGSSESLLASQPSEDFSVKSVPSVKPNFDDVICIKPSMLGNVGLQNAINSVSLPIKYPRSQEGKNNIPKEK